MEKVVETLLGTNLSGRLVQEMGKRLDWLTTGEREF